MTEDFTPPHGRQSRSETEDTANRSRGGIRAGDQTGHSTVAAVAQAIGKYVEGCRAADGAAVAEAFSPDAVMWGYLAGDYVTMSGSDFAEQVVAGAEPAGDEYSHQIHSIEVTGHIATAVLTEKQFQGLDFCNHFGLVHRDGRWRICSKVFTSL